MDKVRITDVDVLRNDAEGIVTIHATTKRGEVYTLGHIFALAEEGKALHLVERIRREMMINLDHWFFWRVVYGSAAYEEEEAEAAGWAGAIRGGLCREADVPDHIRTLL